jgi:GalNAc-alpha-(1->4)-GalNAc-alpha-(1->3)-diNAcBac-PP-undecaprenol alpha-1,4-N-acetyl-D-galactosaminyltransferase
MKITFLVSSLQFGGAERVATTLCNAWAQRGHDVSLIATYSGTEPSYFKLEPAVQLSYLANPQQGLFGRSRRSLPRLYKLRQILVRQQPDIVVSFLPSANIMAILATAGLKLPVIVSERTDPEHYPQSWIWRFMCRHLYQYAALLTVQTEAVAVKVNRLFNHVDRVSVMPNPLPFPQPQLQKNAAGSRFTIISLGRLTEGKQTEHLVRAFTELAGRYPEWDLSIFGDGPQRGALEALIAENLYRSRILMHGDTRQPWVELANADIFAMTSRFEGFPNALLEALGLGLPSVVYDCPSGPAEITEQGRIAALVPLNNQAELIVALEKLMATAQYRQEMGQLAAEVVHQKYGLDAIVEKWEQLFQTVLLNSRN